MSAPPYDEWAPFYDFSEGDRSAFIAFYGSLISSKTRSLLELGCGTGVITIALARRIAQQSEADAAIRITGLDQSAEMLRLARARDERIEWVLGDFQSPPLDGAYDLVICCFYALHNLVTEGELAATFRAVRRLLTPDGVFAFDMYQSNLAYLDRPRSKVVRALTDGGGQHFDLCDDWSYDKGSRILLLDRRLVPAGQSTPVLGHLRIRLRQYFPQEIDRLLAEAGLAVLHRYGGLDRSPFTAASVNQIVLCGRDG